MLKEMFTAAMGMLPQQTRLEVIANNMANAQTAGFKRSEVFERNLIDARENFYNVQGDCEQNDPPVGSYIDFSNGAFQQTGNPLDIAIENDGFFVIQDDEGKESLTRQGHFTVDSEGYIVSQDGKYLEGTEGRLAIRNEWFENPMITEDKKAINIKINQNGEVFANDFRIGSIKIVTVDNIQSLENISKACFIPTQNSDIKEQSEESVSLRQGWLEASNVNIISEMVNMIELQRLFEAGSKVIHTNDATLDNSIRIGRYL